jgi:serine/threonine-protein kinase
VEAYRLYLQGWSLFNRSTEPELRDAIDLFKQVLARDPKFARAWWALAETRIVFLVIGYPLPNALEDAEKEATQALTLDPSLAGANAVLGNVNAIRGKWLEAETLYRNAIARDASDPLILGDYSGNLLDSVGYLRQSLANRRKAYQLAPADIGVILNLSVGYSLMGSDADALKYADLMIKLGLSPDVVPVPIIYANAYARSGHYSEAADRLAIMLPPKLRAAGSDTVIKDVYAALGESARRPAATASLQSLVKRVKADDLDVNTRKVIMTLFVGLDALDSAFQFANQSLDYFARTGTFGSDWGGLWVPEMRPFRRDPRFQAFVTRMGLMDYWNKYGPPDDCDLKNGKLTCH